MGIFSSRIQPQKDLMDLNGKVAIVTGAKYVRSNLFLDLTMMASSALESDYTSFCILFARAPKCILLLVLRKRQMTPSSD